MEDKIKKQELLNNNHINNSIQCLLFLAMDIEHQLSNFGKSKYWFCKEVNNVNPGANYLIGIEGIYLEYCTALYDEVDDDIGELIKAIKLQFDNLDKEDDNWSKDALKTNEFWIEIRIFAKEILTKLELEDVAHKPFYIPDFIRIEQPYYEDYEEWWVSE